MKINIYSLTTFLLLVGSAAQFGHFSITRYFIPMCAFLFAIMAYFFRFKLKFSSEIRNIFFMHLAIFVSFILLDMFSYSSPTEMIFDIVKLTFAFGLSFLVYYSIVYASDKAIEVGIRFMIIIVLTVLGIDTIARFQNFDYNQLILNFYLYKVNSLFFPDSNNLALYGLLFFIVIFYFYKYVYLKKSWFFRIALFVIFICIVLTFSRANILALVTFFLFHLWFTRNNIFFKYFIILLFIGIIILIAPLLIEIVVRDGSGNTKILNL